MKLSFASPQGHGKAASSRNSVVFWLLGIIICYQAAYQICMTFVLSHDNTTLDPWCNGAQNSAQQCVEAELFKGWQSAGLSTGQSQGESPGGFVDALGLLESEDELKGLLEHHTAKVSPSTTPKPLPEATSQPQAVATQVQSPLKARHLEETAASPIANVSTAAMVASDNSSSVRRPLTPWSKGLVALQERLEERMRHRTEERELHRQQRRLHEAHAAIKEFHNMSTLSKDLKALHDRFGARLSARRDHTQSAKAEFGSLTSWAKDVQDLQRHFEAEFVPHDASAAPKADNMTAWSHDLSDLKHRMEIRMEAHNKAHDNLDAHERSRHHHHHPHVPEPKKENGHALLDEIAALGRQMCSDAKHHHDPHCAQFRVSAPASGFLASTSAAPTGRSHHLHGHKFSSLDEAEAQLNGELHKLSDKQHDWEKAFVAKVANTMHDFCSDSVHRTQPTCVQFLSHEAANNMATKKKAWHQKFKAKIANVGHELCNSPMRRDYAICKKFFAETEHATKSGMKVDGVEDDDEEHGSRRSHERLELHWSSVIEASQLATKEVHGSVETGSVASVGDVSRLRTSAHWAGRVPSVACITLVPEGATAKAMMQYFIDNFRLQRYEGGHQLVLVYHHTDKQAAELVHKYADGTFIQGVVARGDDFPSASAFRFGAWVARDSDIIARWDFSAWHHPHRLSMQVRSLALAGRPASLLERWTVMDKAGANTTAQDGDHWDSSLLGEASWMRAKWYPFMDQADAFPAQDLVKLDDASLQVFEEAPL